MISYKFNWWHLFIIFSRGLVQTNLVSAIFFSNCKQEEYLSWLPPPWELIKNFVFVEKLFLLSKAYISHCDND